ncbi:tRNA (guanosine(46)-N7)-methyltransferase TrmB [Rhizosphaericola mali]|uniref:tRNA (guanine(46)-N(7))-methyltransferase n=1 Tax=Rhizosphaericola mali TaxID=2545455 RepID=A0A5P2G9E9_9BACT|nr:tRNA (guanosine(46)-N7)-methyltransferase TrmB [Rhizosphaericola mali]QES90350.1 tRNA (guanosine(46)-N7)-methyltransferase TrmB [Rhizosphaericola mali]
MGQKKLQRFAEIKTFDNVLEYPKDIKGNWKSFFKNENAITLELACGKGEYALGLGRIYADRNFIGVDLKGNRIWRGAKTAIDEGLNNVGFLRSQIDKINDYFELGEVKEIWITFPDPQLRGSKIKKRLTHPRFLRLYQQILAKDGVVHLKTDSPHLYDFTLKVIELFQLELLEANDNVYKDLQVPAELAIKTHYESLDIAGENKVHHIVFKINKDLPLEKDVELKVLCGVESDD